MKKFLAGLSLVALFVAFSANSSACDADGKCKGKDKAGCCMNKAAAHKSCCASKASCSKSESSSEAAATTTPAKAEGTAKASVAPKATATTKANPNK